MRYIRLCIKNDKYGRCHFLHCADLSCTSICTILCPNRDKIISQQLWFTIVLYCCNIVIIQQVCAFTALTVRKRSAARQKSHGKRQFAWIFARNCKGMNSYNFSFQIISYFAHVKSTLYLLIQSTFYPAILMQHFILFLLQNCTDSSPNTR